MLTKFDARGRQMLIDDGYNKGPGPGECPKLPFDMLSCG